METQTIEPEVLEKIINSREYQRALLMEEKLPPNAFAIHGGSIEEVKEMEKTGLLPSVPVSQIPYKFPVEAKYAYFIAPLIDKVKIIKPEIGEAFEKRHPETQWAERTPALMARQVAMSYSVPEAWEDSFAKTTGVNADRTTILSLLSQLDQETSKALKHHLKDDEHFYPEDSLSHDKKETQELMDAVKRRVPEGKLLDAVRQATSREGIHFYLSSRVFSPPNVVIPDIESEDSLVVLTNTPLAKDMVAAIEPITDSDAADLQALGKLSVTVIR